MDTKSNLDQNLEQPCTVTEVLDLMLNGLSERGCLILDETEVSSYNEESSNEIYMYNASENKDIFSRSNSWFMPVQYKDLDILQHCLSKCDSDIQVKRVQLEYRMFEERNLIMLLRYFVYLVDVMRKNEIIWGVGRGSSVSSYILFLIGIHRIDSLKYNLDIEEFLKES
jgi:DNA polymerase III alpha subunit